MQRNVLVAFLASPSDLQEERSQVRETVDRINRIFGKTTGWQIELRGWEDVLPDFRRPQDLINRDVDECDLFIGILWTRWGTPTAGFSSGFEEEFERVRERWLTTKAPHIWLSFRKIDAERLKDPGPQLKEVLTFRKQQIDRNELLYKEFETPEQFAILIHDMLTEFLVRQSTKQSERLEREINKSPEPPAVASGSEPQHEQPTPVGDNEGELIALLERTAGALRKQPDKFDLTLTERARLVVAATAFFSPVHANELLGVHELNIAYRNREDWRHTSAERTLLFRTMVADDDEVCPGWYWLRSQAGEDVQDRICYMALYDHKEDVRRGAVALCCQLHVALDREELERLLNDSKEPVVVEAIRLTKITGGGTAEALLEPLVGDARSAVRDAAGAAFYDLKFARDPAGAILDYIANGAKPTAWLTTARARQDFPLDSAFHKQLLTRPEAHVRTFAAEWLRQRGILDRAGWNQLLDDPVDQVKVIAVEALIDSGETFDWARLEKIFPSPRQGAAGAGALALALYASVDKTALRARQLRRQSAEMLSTNLDFYDLEGPIIYDLICEQNFALLERRIRTDLEFEFLNLKEEADTRLRAILGELAQSVLSRWNTEAIENRQNQFITIALKHLAARALPTDAKIARRFITRSRFPKVVSGAAKLLASVGDASDVDLLLNARKILWGKDLVQAITAAIRLVADKTALLRKLFEDDENIRRIAEVVPLALSQLAMPDRQAIAREMLDSKTDGIRMRGLAAFVKDIADGDLTQILQEYLAHDTYFYNVVTWLDRLLYAPGPLRTLYREQLLRQSD